MSAYWLGVLTLPAIAATAFLIWVVLHPARRGRRRATSCAFCDRRWYAPWWATRELPVSPKQPFDSISRRVHLALHPACKRAALARIAERWVWVEEQGEFRRKDPYSPLADYISRAKAEAANPEAVKLELREDF